ncbi:MAG TPA: heparinase II/III family protein, partial [Pyrinomonadaceae bacterium]|nr:heparinase II/III family protein [Pyrinomonadaceae bacterium]
MNLEKLRNASLHELRVRAAQRLAAFGERRGWSPLVKLPADEAFASLLALERTTTDRLLDHFRSRSHPSFFAAFQTPETTASAFKSRWSSSAEQLIDKANRICEGKFDLLGHRDLSFGEPLSESPGESIDWQFEPLAQKRIPLLHWSKLDYLNAEVAGDKKIIWELNRHQFFVTLGQAYWLTGDEKYARAFVT